MYESFTCIYVCMSTSCMFDASRGQKRSLDPVELELRMLVNNHECWQPIPGLLQEQLLLTSETSFQAQLIFLMCNGKDLTSISNR